jgi:integrase
VRFCGLRHPSELGPAEVRGFLSHLVEDRNLSAATQQQALSALLFLYRNVIGRPLEAVGRLPRGRVPTTLPVVLTRDEVGRVVRSLRGIYRVVGLLLYGSGLRLTECLSLRVKDLDLERGELTVRRGKGGKDRVTMIPEIVRGPLQDHLEGVRALHVQDLASGAGWVEMPTGLVPSIQRRGLRGLGNGCFRLGEDTGIRRAAASCGTTSMSRRFSEQWRPRCVRAGSGSGRAVILCGTHLLLICWKRDVTSGRCRNCWGTGTCRPR